MQKFPSAKKFKRLKKTLLTKGPITLFRRAASRFQKSSSEEWLSWELSAIHLVFNLIIIIVTIFEDYGTGGSMPH